MCVGLVCNIRVKMMDRQRLSLLMVRRGKTDTDCWQVRNELSIAKWQHPGCEVKLDTVPLLASSSIWYTHNFDRMLTKKPRQAVLVFPREDEMKRWQIHQRNGKWRRLTGSNDIAGLDCYAWRWIPRISMRSNYDCKVENPSCCRILEHHWGPHFKIRTAF